MLTSITPDRRRATWPLTSSYQKPRQVSGVFRSHPLKEAELLAGGLHLGPHLFVPHDRADDAVRTLAALAATS